MHNHTRKEGWIKPRERAVETSNQAPSERKVQITCIMNLACVSIPSIYENRISRSGCDSPGIFDRLPRQLRECFALNESAAFLCAETVLLGVCCVPDPIHEEIAGEERNNEVLIPGIGGWRVIGQIECAVAVG